MGDKEDNKTFNAKNNTNIVETGVYEPEMTTPIKPRNQHNTVVRIFMLKFLFVVSTILQSLPFVLINEIRNYLKLHSNLVYLAVSLYALSMLVYAFWPTMQIKKTCYWISAVLMVEFLTAIIAIISSYYGLTVMMIALGATFSTCVLLAIFGLVCTINLEKITTAIFVLGAVIIAVGVCIYVVDFFVKSYEINIIYSSLALIVMYVYYLHAVQGLNEKTYQMDESEKFFVAVYLYTNFMTIFLLCESIISTIKI